MPGAVSETVFDSNLLLRLAAERGRLLSTAGAFELVGLLYDWAIAERPDDFGALPGRARERIADWLDAPLAEVHQALGALLLTGSVMPLIDLLPAANIVARLPSAPTPRPRKRSVTTVPGAQPPGVPVAP